MADEALRELAGAFRTAAIGLASVTFDAGRGEQRLTVSEAGEYADALESALSELARLRGERDSGMDHSQSAPADAARDHPTDE